MRNVDRPRETMSARSRIRELILLGFVVASAVGVGWNIAEHKSTQEKAKAATSTPTQNPKYAELDKKLAAQMKTDLSDLSSPEQDTH